MFVSASGALPGKASECNSLAIMESDVICLDSDEEGENGEYSARM